MSNLVARLKVVVPFLNNFLVSFVLVKEAPPVDQNMPNGCRKKSPILTKPLFSSLLTMNCCNWTQCCHSMASHWKITKAEFSPLSLLFLGNNMSIRFDRNIAKYKPRGPRLVCVCVRFGIFGDKASTAATAGQAFSSIIEVWNPHCGCSWLLKKFL